VDEERSEKATPEAKGSLGRLQDAAARVAFLAATLSVGAAVGLTFSLGAWLGTAAALVGMLLAARRRRPALALGVLTLCGALGTGVLSEMGLLPERVNPFRATSGVRVELWLSSLAMLRDHPLLGVGLDNFGYLYYHVYLRPGGTPEPNLSHPHNWVLHLWLQIGLLGLIAFCWLLWRLFTNLRSALDAPATRWLAVGIVGAAVDTLIHGLLDNSYFLTDLAFLWWILLSLGATVVQVNR
jgi:O-antigen ligase